MPFAHFATNGSAPDTDYAAQVRDLERRLAEAEEALDRARFVDPGLRASKPDHRDTRIRVVMPDVHGNHMDRAAAATVQKVGGCIVYGHTHRADYSPTRTVAAGLIAAWCPGCLSQLQPMWRHSSPTDWSQGYIVQFIAPDETFQTVQVPISNGRSFLGPVMKALGKHP